MSEPKRVSLTTISSMASNGNAPPTCGSGGGNFLAPNALPTSGSVRFGVDLFTEPQPKSNPASSQIHTEEPRTTVRLSLELSPTDKVTYPEINYARLMRLEDKKRKKLKHKINGASSSSMPFEEKDDDVARIAAELEKKYGCAYGRGRGRSKRDDACDLGMGYDESDSFIDNTDAYDEIIPEDVETVEGGFYINCGALEFKQLNTETVKLKTDEIIKMPSKSRKRILSVSSSSDDSSSSENEENTVTNEKNDQNDSESSGSTSKSKSTNPNATKRSKKENASKKGMQHDGKKEKTKTAISASASNSPKPPAVYDEPASDGSDKDRGIARQKTIKTTTIKDMLKAKRDSFLKMQGDAGEGSKSVNGELRGVASKSSDDESSDSSGDDEDSKSESDSNHSTNVPQIKIKLDGKPETVSSNTAESTEKLRSSDTKLPELEPEVVTNIQSFKEIVKSKNITGKRFQFDEGLTELFLRIDENLLCMEKSQRNMVFAHLEYTLILPKYFFLRKAKQLRVKMEKLKTQRALGKLRKAVIEAMPGVIANYEVEVRKYTDLQSTNPPNGNLMKMPKKKFPWSSNIRNLLYDVYQSRWISYPTLCTRKESLEDFITVYLKDKVVEIWPNGWMRFEELQKEIEKRKQANKKSKEKKAANLNNAPIMPSSMPTALNTNTIPTVTSANLTSYAKQFEEFANSRSGCNSDTDSVTSSNASNGSGLKRKSHPEDSNNKKKAIRPKGNTNSNGSLTCITEEGEYPNVTPHVVANMRVDLTTISEGSPQPIQTPSVLPLSVATNASVSNTLSQENSIHSNIISSSKTTAHVIDLDQYSSASDILEKSKQLQKASVNISSPLLLDNVVNLKPLLERTNSSDSDGVEIVGIFQANENSAAKVRPKKIQQMQQIQQNSMPNTVVFNNNNIKLLTSGISNAFDVNTALNALKDLERSQISQNTAVGGKESLQ